MAQPTDDSLSDQINMVGEGTVFEGTLRAKSNVRVSGRVKGTLQVEGRAIVTQEGAVEGEVRSTDADIAGSVQGEIHVEERLMLKSSARIDGSIEAGRIKVEEGALFTGQCSVGEDVKTQVQRQLGESSGSAGTPGESAGTSGKSAPAGNGSSRSGSASSSASSSGSASSSTGGKAQGAKRAAEAASEKKTAGKK